MQVSDRFWNEFKNDSLKMKYNDEEKEDTQFTRAALAMVKILIIMWGV